MKKLVFLSIFVIALCAPCFAQFGNETITITTYYPSPHGVYGVLTLYPRDSQPDPATSRKGDLYYDSGTEDPTNRPEGVYAYNGSVWVQTNIGGGDASSGDILVNAAHTKKDCRDEHGTPVDSGTSFQICQFNASECPTGWHQYENWGTYVQTTGCCYGGTCYCVYPRHAFGSEYGLNATSWGNYRPCGDPGGTHCVLHDAFHPYPYYISWDSGTYCSVATQIGCY